MLKPIALTLLGLALIVVPINAQGDGGAVVVEVITLKNLDLEILSDGDLLIRFTANANIPANVNLATSDYEISFWYDSNENPDNPNITTISSTGASDGFRLNKSESLSINSWCSNIGTKTPVMMSFSVELRGVVTDGSKIFREVKVFHTDVSGRVEDCKNR